MLPVSICQLLLNGQRLEIQNCQFLGKYMVKFVDYKFLLVVDTNIRDE